MSKFFVEVVVIVFLLIFFVFFQILSKILTILVINRLNYGASVFALRIASRLSTVVVRDFDFIQISLCEL